MEASFRITGSYREWAVRLPSLLSYLLVGAIMFFGLRQKIGKKTAALAGIFFLFSADLLFYGTVNAGEMDLFLTLPVFAQLIVFPLLYEKRKWLAMFALSYACMAIVFLTKHFAAFAFQAIGLVTLFMLDKNWRVLLSWQHIVGGCVFVTLTGAYFFSYAQTQPLRFLVADLIWETTDKSGSESFAERLTYMAIYPFTWLKLLFPWSLLVIMLWRKNIWIPFRENHLLKFSLIFSTLNLGLYWLLPETRDRYLYPLFPFFCIVLAIVFEQSARLSFRTAAWFSLAMAITRIVYNETVMPVQQAARSGRKDALEVVRLTNREPVYLTGLSNSRKVEIHLLGKQIISENVQFPAEIPYAIPYYFAVETGHFMDYHATPMQGNFYLAPAGFEEIKANILYTIDVNYIKGGLVLYKME